MRLVDRIRIKGRQDSSLSVFSSVGRKMPYADLQKRRDNVRRWKKANPDKVKAQKQRYRTRRAQSPQPPLSPLPQGRHRYNLRQREVKRPEKIQLVNLVVVLKDFRKKDTPQCQREIDNRQKSTPKKNQSYYQRNRHHLLARKKSSVKETETAFWLDEKSITKETEKKFWPVVKRTAKETESIFGSKKKRTVKETESVFGSKKKCTVKENETDKGVR